MNTDATKVMDQKQVRLNRIKLLAVFAVALVPVLLAATMYFGGFALPSGKTNKGHLIWPPLEFSTLETSGAKAASFLEAEKKWLLVVTGTGECDALCAERLHTARQVNVAMGREMERVSRIMITNLATQSITDIASKYPSMKIFAASVEDLAAFENLATNNGAEVDSDRGNWNIWLVDPLGNVLLQYDPENSGYDMIDDLKKLLKLSNIG